MSHTHTHTHTYIEGEGTMQVLETGKSHTRTHTLTRTHKHTHTLTHTYTHALTHTCTHTHMHTHIHIHSHTYTHTHRFVIFGRVLFYRDWPCAAAGSLIFDLLFRICAAVIQSQFDNKHKWTGCNFILPNGTHHHGPKKHSLMNGK